MNKKLMHFQFVLQYGTFTECPVNHKKFMNAKNKIYLKDRICPYCQEKLNSENHLFFYATIDDKGCDVR